MTRSAKIAISLPPELLARVDADRRASGISRSEAFRQALESQLQRERQEEAVQTYLLGYKEHPENENEIEEASSMSKVALAEEPWE